jgi:hypothetical protein
LHEFLVTFALVTTEVEVAMCGFYTITQTLQDKQKRHTVGSAADSHNVEPIHRQQPVFRDIALNPILQATHNERH